jgi:hypothetical protein
MSRNARSRRAKTRHLELLFWARLALAQINDRLTSGVW